MNLKYIVFALLFLTSNLGFSKTDNNLSGKWIGFFNSMTSCHGEKVKFKHNKANMNQGVVLEYKDNNSFSAQLLYSVEYILNSMKKKYSDPKFEDKKNIINNVISTLTEVPNPEASHCIAERSGTYTKNNLKIEQTLKTQKWLYCFGLEDQISKIYGPNFPSQNEVQTKYLSEKQKKDKLTFDDTKDYAKRLVEIENKKGFWKSANKCISKKGSLLTTYKKIY